MRRTELEHFNCSFARTLDILGDRWTLMIIRDAFYGISRFSDFQSRLGMARNILADRLEQLVTHNILVKVPTRPGVERFSYRLTERGKELYPALVAFCQWGDKWIFGCQGEPVRILDKKTGAPVQKVAVVSRDGRYLESQDITYAPGPGASAATMAIFEEVERKRREQQPS